MYVLFLLLTVRFSASWYWSQNTGFWGTVFPS